jgi:hypothetical protein
VPPAKPGVTRFFARHFSVELSELHLLGIENNWREKGTATMDTVRSIKSGATYAR